MLSRLARLAGLIALLTVAVSGQSGSNTAWPITIDQARSPAGPDSAQPQLSSSARGLLLSWIERDGPKTTLRFAERTANGWSAVRDVASGTDWFVNWADVPSVIRLASGELAAHWLQKSGSDT